MIFIAVKFDVRPEHGSQWLARVADFTEATRAEPGNLFFEWSRSVDDPDQFVLLEAFRDADAGTLHVGSAHFEVARRTLPPALARTPQVVNVEVPGADWSELGEFAVDAGARGRP